MSGLSEAQPKRKTLYTKTKAVAHTKTKAVAQISKRHHMLRRLAALFVVKRTVKTAFGARGAKIGPIKTVPN
jgi:hypothetical protein